jgi:predicted RNA-binding protein (virulence factor B family)
MESIDGYFVARGVEVATTDSFKFVKDGDMQSSLGGNGQLAEYNYKYDAMKYGSDIRVKEAGSYDLYINDVADTYYVMEVGKNPAEAYENVKPGEDVWYLTGLGEEIRLRKSGIFLSATSVNIDEDGFKLRNTLTGEYGAKVDGVAEVDDEIEVFVYHDSEDRLVATTDKPLITEGRVAYLKVIDKNIHGAFLDWGVSGKDLFLPNRNQQGGVMAGRSYVVWLYVDNITGRCVATMKLKGFVDNDVITVEPRQKVDLLIASESPIGYRAIINSRHWGMIYKNQIFSPVKVGDSLEGYVRRITEDNRIDLSLRREGYDGVAASAETLYALLKDCGGVLSVGDDSSPEEVHAATQMSKKVFKRAVGMLLKRGDIVAEAHQIKLKK